MASVQTTAEDILDESIEQAKSSLQSQELLKQAQDVVIANERIDKAGAHGPGEMAMTTCPGAPANAGIQAGPKQPWIQITLVGGVLTNKTKGAITVMDQHKYAGHIVSRYPSPLKIAGTFAMSALTDKGVKAAVVYSGKNKHDVNCGWLLAFADTEHTGRRIYAECGRKENFTKVDWAEVEKKLNNAGTIAKASDMATETSFYATIVGSSGKSAIGAVYLG